MQYLAYLTHDVAPHMFVYAAKVKFGIGTRHVCPRQSERKGQKIKVDKVVYVDL
jgi:hypothetical protein